jgi:hypothetical protein
MVSVCEIFCTFAEDMKKILFVCHGNICRSPMAEFVMNAAKWGLADVYHKMGNCAQAVTLYEEVLEIQDTLKSRRGPETAQRIPRRLRRIKFHHRQLSEANATGHQTLSHTTKSGASLNGCAACMIGG